MSKSRAPSAAAVSSAIAEAFGSSAAETRRALLASADIRTMAVDDVVTHQGEDPSFIVIVAGHAGLRRTTVDGRRFMTRVLAHGDVVGLPALVYHAATADLIGLSAGAIARWSADDLRRFALTDPGFGLDVLDHALWAYEDVVERSDGLVHQDAVARVTRVLYRYRGLFFAATPVLTMVHLPMLVGTSREMAGRVIRTLESRRIVARVGRHGLELLDPAGLETLGRWTTDPTGGPASARGRNALLRARRPLAPNATRAAGIPAHDPGPGAVLDASPNAIVAVDASARITYANPQAEVTFGYSREELLGRSVELLLPDRVAERHVAHRDGFTQNPRARPMGIGLDLAGRRRDGTEFPVEISLAPVGTGEKLQVYATVVDITARKTAENQLLQAQKLESIGRLAGGIAHDFNNMLFAISGYTEMLEEDLAAAPDTALDLEGTRRSVKAIAVAADRAAALTMQLLMFSRRQAVTPRVLDLGDSVRAIEPMLRPIIGETIRLNLHLDPAAGHVRADPGQLDQILVNLVVNARDAMPDGGTITIETGNTYFDEPFAVEHFEVRPGPYVMLIVSDTGQGMDTATKEHIFEPFFTTKETGKGTGLGLATIYGIVRQAGGHIWLYSEPGRGSTFKLYFPRDDATPTPEPRRRPRASVGGGRLLVVEDEPAVRAMTTALLERAGHSVVAVGDAQEALALVPRLDVPIDVLVTDVVMPGLSGLDLADRMLELVPDLGVVLLSGYTAETLDPARLTARGAIFVSKPIASRELLEAIGRVMPARRRS